VSSSKTPLYTWQSGQQVVKKRLHVNDNTYIPTSENGIYSRVETASSSPSSPTQQQQNQQFADDDRSEITGISSNNNFRGGSGDKFIDVQIVLTEDEFNAYVHRKIKLRDDRRHEHNDLAAMSPMGVPYVSSKRMLKDHFRGGDTAAQGRFAV
jgi:hypothetical protein